MVGEGTGRPPSWSDPLQLAECRLGTGASPLPRPLGHRPLGQELPCPRGVQHPSLRSDSAWGWPVRSPAGTERTHGRCGDSAPEGPATLAHTDRFPQAPGRRPAAPGTQHLRPHPSPGPVGLLPTPACRGPSPVHDTAEHPRVSPHTCGCRRVSFPGSRFPEVGSSTRRMGTPGIYSGSWSRTALLPASHRRAGLGLWLPCPGPSRALRGLSVRDVQPEGPSTGASARLTRACPRQAARGPADSRTPVPSGRGESHRWSQVPVCRGTKSPFLGSPVLSSNWSWKGELSSAVLLPGCASLALPQSERTAWRGWP